MRWRRNVRKEKKGIPDIRTSKFSTLSQASPYKSDRYESPPVNNWSAALHYPSLSKPGGRKTPTAERKTSNAHLEDPTTDHGDIVLVEVMIYVTPSHTCTDDSNSVFGIILNTVEPGHVKQDAIVYVRAEWRWRMTS